MSFTEYFLVRACTLILTVCLVGCERPHADADSTTDSGNKRAAAASVQPTKPPLSRSRTESIEPGTALTEDGFREALRKTNAKYIVVQVYQEGCGPCITESLQLAERQATLRRKDVAILGMGMDETADACKKFFKQAGERISFPLYLAPWFAEQRDVFMTPTLFVFGADGNVLFRTDPEQAEEGVMAAMDKELARLLGD